MNPLAHAGILTRLLAGGCLLALWMGAGVSAQEVRKAMKDPLPIHIVSDRMVADNKKQWVHFIGNVTTTRGDLVIHSDRLEVYRDAKTSKVERIEAIGRVDINRGNRYATGDKAIYYENEQKVALLGKPKVWEEDNIIVGHKIFFFLETDQLIVEGNSSRRVDVVLYPKKEEKRDRRRGPSDSQRKSPPGDRKRQKAEESATPTRDARSRQVVSEPTGRQ